MTDAIMVDENTPLGWEGVSNQALGFKNLFQYARR